MRMVFLLDAWSPALRSLETEVTLRISPELQPIVQIRLSV